MQVFLRPEQLQSLRVGVDQVIEAIRAANQDLPAGSISRAASEQLVRVEGKIKDPRGFERIIVANQGGAPVYLGQVADIVDGEAEEQSISRVDGMRSVSLYVYRAQQANIVKVGDGVDEAIAELQGRLPEDVKIRTLWSDAKWIEGSLDRVKETIVEGALLTILIVFLFLHSWRSTIITGLTLPISVIATFIALHFFGFTLNFMTLMALSLCIGLLIDDAIVVRENIVRHADMGKSHRDAALEGTQEIGLAVMATTFAILAVFIPVAFMSGVIGRFFLQFGITVAVAVLVSLFVSFTLDPMLSSIWPDPSEGRFRRVPWLGRVMDRVERVVEGAHVVYDRLLGWALSGRRYARCHQPARGAARRGRGDVLRQLHDRAAGRHRVRAAAGRRHGLHAPEHADRLEPAIHRRQDSRRRSGAFARSRASTPSSRRSAPTKARTTRASRVVLADLRDQQAPAADRRSRSSIRERLSRMAGLTVSINQQQPAGRAFPCSVPTAAS